MLPDTIEQWVAELAAAYDEKFGEDPEPDWVPVLNFLTVLVSLHYVYFLAFHPGAKIGAQTRGSGGVLGVM